MNELIAALNVAFAGTTYSADEDYGELIFSQLGEPIDFDELPKQLQRIANDLLEGPFAHLMEQGAEFPDEGDDPLDRLDSHGCRPCETDEFYERNDSGEYRWM